MQGLNQEVCVGLQKLRGKKLAVADAARALTQLDRVAGGQSIVRGDPGKDAIKVMQRALVILGYSTSKSVGYADGSAVIDGDFGGGTERGLMQFQIERGLEPTGIFNAATLGTLDRIVATRLSPMDEDERLRQRDVLDNTIKLSAADLKRQYRPGIADAATVGGVKEEVVAAIMIVESNGGGYNRPKFESHHFVALQDMHNALLGIDIELASSQRIAALAKTVSSLSLRPGENGQTTKLSRTLLDTMAGSTATEPRRQALLIIQRWSLQDQRELATSWGWGQIMGWHTLRPEFRRVGITLAGLQSQKPGQQISMLGRAISAESSWREAARKADETGDYSYFAQAYNGAKRGTDKNNQYASVMRQAAAEYRNA